MGATTTTILALLAASLLTLALLRFTSAAWVVDPDRPSVRLLGTASPLLTWLIYRRPPRFDRARGIDYLRTQSAWLEIGGVLAWAAWVGRDFLISGDSQWPQGGDWSLNVFAYFPWTLLEECGACVMWDGFRNGGAPTFVDLVGAAAHPLMAALVTLFGPVTGSKLGLVAGLAMAGLAQWWLASVLGLGRAARLWSAGLAVVGGHLAGRMYAGLVEEVFSAAACALVIPAALDVALTRRRRSTVALGLTLGLAGLAGQGYMQIALVLALLPPLGVFAVTGDASGRAVRREFALGALIAVLIAAVLWVPLLHFWPNIWKPSDPTFASSRGIDDLLLNLVVDDPDYYRSSLFDDYPYPAWYVNFLGWVPLVLGLFGWQHAASTRWRVAAYFAAAIGLVYLLSSAVMLRWLSLAAPNLTGLIRTPTVMQSMAAPLILGLAALGLDRLMRRPWPQIAVGLNNTTTFSTGTRWLVTAGPLLWALAAAYWFGREWMFVEPRPDRAYPVLEAVRLDRTQWVLTPGGETWFAVAALDRGLKVGEMTRPWQWVGRTPPPARIVMTRNPAAESSPNYVRTIDGIYIVAQPAGEYAFVQTAEGQTPCRARALGGNIDVECDNRRTGTLVVTENNWTGWSVFRDGQAASLGGGRWLETAAPAGRHHYEFRYRPWDVPLGLALSIAGLVVAVWLNRRAPAMEAAQSC